jgi:hypothetical protein
MNSSKMAKEEALLLAKFACIKNRSLAPFFAYLCVGSRFGAMSWALAGRSVRFMSRDEIKKISLYARVYCYLKQNDFSAKHIDKVHYKYDLRYSRIKAIIGMGRQAEEAVFKMIKEEKPPCPR